MWSCRQRSLYGPLGAEEEKDWWGHILLSAPRWNWCSIKSAPEEAKSLGFERTTVPLPRLVKMNPAPSVPSLLGSVGSQTPY